METKNEKDKPKAGTFDEHGREIFYGPDGKRVNTYTHNNYAVKPDYDARIYDAPAYNEKGKPIWPEDWLELCRCCLEWKWRGYFTGIHKAHNYCKTCRKESIRKNNQHKPRKNRLAYTHVIRDRYDKTKVYKFSILDGKIPKGYDVVYKAHSGELLPPVYRLLPVFKKELFI